MACANELDLSEVDVIVKKFEFNVNKLIPILSAIQHEYRYLPQAAMSRVATILNIPAARVFGVATFYAHFALQPKGENVIRVCKGTACHVKGADKLIDAIYEKLKLSPTKQTTDDMQFTIEMVSCLGACGLAPVLVVGEDVYGQVKADGINAIVDKYIKK